MMKYTVIFAVIYVLSFMGTAQSQCDLERIEVVGVHSLNRASLDVFEGRVIVGVPNHYYTSGLAVVFAFDGTRWIEEARFAPQELKPRDNFGRQVALGADFALVSSPGDDTSNLDAGAVYLFRREGTEWTREDKFQSTNPVPGQGFGSIFDVDGDELLVGMSGVAIFAFEWNGSGWKQKQRLVGYSPVYAIDGGWFVTHVRDRLRFHKLVDGLWEVAQTIEPEEGERLSNLEVVGDRVFVKALGLYAACVQVYKLVAGVWKLTDRVGECSGYGMAAARDSLAVRFQRSVQLYEYASLRGDTAGEFASAWRRTAVITSPERPNDDFCDAMATDDRHLVLSGCTDSVWVWTYGESSCCHTQFRRFGIPLRGSGGG